MKDIWVVSNDNWALGNSRTATTPSRAAEVVASISEHSFVKKIFFCVRLGCLSAGGPLAAPPEQPDTVM